MIAYQIAHSSPCTRVAITALGIIYKGLIEIIQLFSVGEVVKGSSLAPRTGRCRCWPAVLGSVLHLGVHSSGQAAITRFSYEQVVYLLSMIASRLVLSFERRSYKWCG